MLYYWDTPSVPERPEPPHGARLLPYPFSALFLPDEHFQALLAQTPPPPQISLLGAGDFHFLTWFLLQRIEKPFVLVLVDHHSDAQESSFDLLSCGNWLLRAVELPMLLEARLFGPEPGELPRKARLVASSQDLWAGDGPFYLSVDKDILDPEELELGWEQGELQIEELLRLVADAHHLLGADLCGEPPPNPSFYQAKAAMRRRSGALNDRIISLLRDPTRWAEAPLPR